MSSKEESNIWFHLYDSANGLPYMGTTADYVSLPPSADIAQFRKAVKAEFSNTLSSVDAGKLLVFKNKQSFDKRKSKREKVNDFKSYKQEVPLEEDSPVDGLGKSKKDALIVSSAELNSQRGTRLITKYQVSSKTIDIRQVDDDGDLTDEYKEYKVKDKEDLRDIYKYGTGLIQLSAPKKVIVNFDEIEDGKKYQVHNYSQAFAGWQKKEADAMEAETLLHMRTFLEELKDLKAKESPISLPTEFLDKKGRKIQEWDGILSTKSTLYLLEAKHTMTVKKVYKIVPLLHTK